MLLPIHEFEKKMLQRMEEIDGIVLAVKAEPAGAFYPQF